MKTAAPNRAAVFAINSLRIAVLGILGPFVHELRQF
jgi:hypothetical protein